MEPGSLPKEESGRQASEGGYLQSCRKALFLESRSIQIEEERNSSKTLDLQPAGQLWLCGKV